MFEIYAFAASVLIPTGLICVLYIFYFSKTVLNQIQWNKIIHSLSTVCLGIFYLYSAIILSKNTPSRPIYENNIDDFAIINDTTGNNDLFMFYPETDNEVEDTREHKIEDFQRDFLQKYHNLVQAAIKKKLQKISEIKERSERKLIWKEENLTTEDQYCFLKTFFYQALLVYSFISCVVSLINTCQNYNELTISKSVESSLDATDSFGEKINDIPIQTPSSSNYDPFVVSTKRSGALNKSPENSKTLKLSLECFAIMFFPQIMVFIVYIIMNTNVRINDINKDINLELLPNFNFTRSDTQTNVFIGNIFKQNNTHQQNETENILMKVYDVIGKFKEDQKSDDVAKRQYLGIAHFLDSIRRNITNNCIDDNIYLKTFDFIIFILIFFLTILFSKVQQVKKSNCKSLNKCIWAFITFWTPCIIDVIVKTFLMQKEADFASALLLMFGSMDIIYFNFRHIHGWKFGKNTQIVQPAGLKK